jgi:3-hydroxyacyl-[acyl-carrier-protein] dehydratase
MHNELYAIHDWQQEAASIACTVTYDPAHPIFSGHFPGQPVVPGVCTMDMIKDMLQTALGQPLLLRSTGQVKFLRLILPDVKPDVAISWQANEQGYNVTASLKAANEFLFKMNAVFEVR